MNERWKVLKYFFFLNDYYDNYYYYYDKQQVQCNHPTLKMKPGSEWIT